MFGLAEVSVVLHMLSGWCRECGGKGAVEEKYIDSSEENDGRRERKARSKSEERNR